MESGECLISSSLAGIGRKQSWLRMVQVSIHVAKIGNKGSVVTAGIGSPISFTTGL